MTLHLDDGDVRVHAGDCTHVMASMDEASVDAIVCDPPYGLEFMGKDWDSFRASNSGVQKSGFEKLGKNGTPAFSPNRRNQKCPKCGKWAYDHPGRKCECGGWKQPAQALYSSAFQAWCEAWGREALRVLKPGGHLLAFGGTRTFHRLTAGLEDAGFEIRDTLSWLYGSGFPKSLDVSKAIDKAAGADREVIGTIPDRWTGKGNALNFSTDRPQDTVTVTGAPATDAAREWGGWGTALKPAWEPIVLARKPLAGTVAHNVQQHRTGALNIDGCRVAATGRPHIVKTGETWEGSSFDAAGSRAVGTTDTGRWPANVVLDEVAAQALDAQAGERPTSKPGQVIRRRDPDEYSSASIGAESRPAGAVMVAYGDTGGPSRFFYTAKASTSERNNGHGPANTHPTVKPVDLMRWCIRLITPPGGVVLDPFAGSGTTGVAARAEGMRAVLIEREAEYLQIIAGRLSQLSLLGGAA